MGHPTVFPRTHHRHNRKLPMPDPASRPNLLYIHSDQHAQRVLDCYGDPLLGETNLGRLAAGGTVFDNVYCDSPICVPSRMSMLTGLRPYETGVWTNEQQLDSAFPTLAHSLGAAGYLPVLIGRMHANGPDQLHGYTRRLVGDHGPNQIGGPSVDRGGLEGTAGPHRISLVKSGPGQSAYQLHDEDVYREAKSFLTDACRELQTGRRQIPFNLSVGFMLPHPPYVATREDFDRFAGSMTLPRKRVPMEDVQHPFLRWWRTDTEIQDVPDEEVLRARAAYWGLVWRMDQWIGDLIQVLKDHDQFDNTLIIYTSDHGDMLGEHSLWWKHVFYEESVKVPLIMSWPGRIPANQRCERVMSGIDVTATLLDLMGAPPLPESSGRSVLPELLNPGSANWQDVAFSEYSSRLFAPDEGCYQRMIRDGDFKLVYHAGLPSQLFNLADDPDELTDLGQDPAYRDVRQRLEEAVLDGWDPAAISDALDRVDSANSIFQKWGRNTKVTDSIRWRLDPSMNWLEADQT